MGIASVRMEWLQEVQIRRIVVFEEIERETLLFLENTRFFFFSFFFYILVHSITIVHLIFIQHEHIKINSVTNMFAIYCYINTRFLLCYRYTPKISITYTFPEDVS